MVELCSKMPFGIDDNKWFDLIWKNPDTSTGWHSQTLYEIDPETGEMRPVEGPVPFGMVVGSIGDTIGCGEIDGRIFAYTDREYFIYPQMLERYIDGKKKDLGYQGETSIVIGIDWYHYTEAWWLHDWGNWLSIIMVILIMLITMHIIKLI